MTLAWWQYDRLEPSDIVLELDLFLIQRQDADTRNPQSVLGYNLIKDGEPDCPHRIRNGESISLRSGSSEG